MLDRRLEKQSRRCDCKQNAISMRRTSALGKVIVIDIRLR